MREIRQSGSEGGGTETNWPSLPLSNSMDFRLFTRRSKLGSCFLSNHFFAFSWILGRTPSYSEEDHLLTVEDSTYQYDLDGFLVGKTQGTNVSLYNYFSSGEFWGHRT